MSASSVPGAVIGIPDSIAAFGEAEFAIPVVQTGKAEFDYRRLLWAVSGTSSLRLVSS